MVNWLIELSLRNRFLVIALFVLLGAWGYWALLTTPIDAIPDLSDNQVIVFTDWPGRSPQEVEDQVTYPLTVSLQGLPGVRVVRATSAFGFSMINVIFEDAVDIYFETAVGETNLVLTIEGRQRFPVRVRYAPQYRSSSEALASVPVPAPNGMQIPLGQLVEIKPVSGPSMISSENGLLVVTVRPKVMTVSTVVASPLPIMWSHSTGAEVMKPLATPVLGGMVSSLIHVLLVTPVIFYWLRERELRREERRDAVETDHALYGRPALGSADGHSVPITREEK